MIYHNLPFDQYLAINALSSTSFKDFITSPTLYKYNKDNPRESTKAQDFGTAVHSYSLERDTFNDEYIALEPETIKAVEKYREKNIDFKKIVAVPKQKKTGASWKSLVEIHEGKDIIWQEDYDKLIALFELDAEIGNKMMITNEMHKDLIDMDLRIYGQNELSVEFEYRGVRCKARFDSVSDDGWITDVKTTANPYNFDYEIKKWKYYIQCGFYWIAYQQVFNKDPKGFKYMVVPNKQPYSDMSVVTMHPEYVQYGVEIVNKNIDNFKWCLQNDDFKREVQFSEAYKPDYLI